MPRLFSPALDAAIDAEPVKVLDHGFIRVVDYCGTEETIERAARQSYATDPVPRLPEERRTLLRYLMRHRHTTPLEMCEIAFQVKLPIFVARQWIRHRMANINELSGRYSVLDKEFYIPEAGQMCSQSLTNKQGRAEPVPEANLLMEEMRCACNDSFGMYDGANHAGLTRELARIVLPLSTYTTWTWKCDLHNLLHFLGLRLDSHAQYEIRVYADQIWKWVCEWVPVISEAFTDYRLEAMTLSRLEVEALQKIIGSIAVTGNPDIISPQFVIDSIPNKREREEFLTKLNRLTET